VERFGTIRYEVAEGIGAVILARPDKRNAIDQTMFEELGRAFQAASASDEVRGVLVAGQGVSFCAGIDLSTLTGLAGIRGAEFQSFVRLAQRPYRLLTRMAKPTVAAVQGHALGAGFQLALACDLRVVATDARFAMLEARYGLIPDLSGPHRLARLIGPARAKELVWSTRTVDAAEADRMGLANRLVEPDQVEAVARQLLAEVTAHSPAATALTKSLIDEATETPLENEFERELAAQAICIESADD
jgi:enoyl-CoA hydratase